MLAAAAFLALTVSTVLATEEDKRSTKCYGDLGCFPTGGPFISLGRPINVAPDSPTKINTRFMLFTRQNQGNGSYEFLNANNYASLRNSYFAASKQTKIAVHGFLHSGFAPFMTKMKDELLKYGDFNVILVDWSSGSNFPYTQATANTRVVGAEIAKLIRTLQSQVQARPQDFHIIGHSLGSHIAGYAGERTPNLGRITGLDPAGPYFENTDPVVRLDPTDANFVDVMHTDAENFIHFPRLGLGTSQPSGHVDYWPNSGKDQAGCDKDPFTALQQETFDLYNGAKVIIACNHLRAPDYFIESINSVCPFEGYQCRDYQSFEKGMCLPCAQGQCGYMGFHADRMKPTLGKQNVAFYLDTGDRKPYCMEWSYKLLSGYAGTDHIALYTGPLKSPVDQSGYHYQIKIAFGSGFFSSKQEGKISINLMGNNGQLGETEITKDFRDIEPGHTYGFLVKSTHEVGTIDRISFSWQRNWHILHPSSWIGHSLIIDSVEVISGETQFKRKFCAGNAHVASDTPLTLNKVC